MLPACCALATQFLDTVRLTCPSGGQSFPCKKTVTNWACVDASRTCATTWRPFKTGNHSQIGYVLECTGSNRKVGPVTESSLGLICNHAATLEWLASTNGVTISGLDSCFTGVSFFLLDSFIRRQTVALETRCLCATSVRPIPATRSRTIAARSTLSGARPILRPSNFARLIPALTRSTIKLRSSSAMAPTITTIARPNGPPVSMFSRMLTNSMFRWLSSSSTSKKWRTFLATRSNAATRTTSKRCLPHLPKAGLVRGV